MKLGAEGKLKEIMLIKKKDFFFWITQSFFHHPTYGSVYFSIYVLLKKIVFLSISDLMHYKYMCDTQSM